jgi:hypothetical protein
MKTSLLALAVTLLLSAAHHPQQDVRLQRCEQAKQKIRKIHSKMRQGYTAKQGVRLEEELRRQREKRSKNCR